MGALWDFGVACCVRTLVWGGGDEMCENACVWLCDEMCENACVGGLRQDVRERLCMVLRQDVWFLVWSREKKPRFKP